MAENDRLHSVPDRLNYRFDNPALLETALTHRSAGSRNNERLEYLGDAVLDFIIADALFHKFPAADEGILTRLRATLVKRETLARLARSLELGNELILGSGELKSGGWRRDSILSNALEAIIGAIYIDGGLEHCRKFVLELFDRKLSDLSLTDTAKDPKTELQELMQARRQPLPVYEVVGEQGEAHTKLFTVRCRVDVLDREVTAEGRSKRIAEQAAAGMMLESIRMQKA